MPSIWYKKKDPIEQVKDTILKKKYAKEEDLAKIDVKIKAIVEESVKFAEESSYPDTSQAYEHVYVQKDYPFIQE